MTIFFIIFLLLVMTSIIIYYIHSKKEKESLLFVANKIFPIYESFIEKDDIKKMDDKLIQRTISFIEGFQRLNDDELNLKNKLQEKIIKEINELPHIYVAVENKKISQFIVAKNGYATSINANNELIVKKIR